MAGRLGLTSKNSPVSWHKWLASSGSQRTPKALARAASSAGNGHADIKLGRFDVLRALA